MKICATVVGEVCDYFRLAKSPHPPITPLFELMLIPIASPFRLLGQRQTGEYKLNSPSPDSQLSHALNPENALDTSKYSTGKEIAGIGLFLRGPISVFSKTLELFLLGRLLKGLLAVSHCVYQAIARYPVCSKLSSFSPITCLQPGTCASYCASLMPLV